MSMGKAKKWGFKKKKPRRRQQRAIGVDFADELGLKSEPEEKLTIKKKEPEKDRSPKWTQINNVVEILCNLWNEHPEWSFDQLVRVIKMRLKRGGLLVPPLFTKEGQHER